MYLGTVCNWICGADRMLGSIVIVRMSRWIEHLSSPRSFPCTLIYQASDLADEKGPQEPIQKHGHS